MTTAMTETDNLSFSKAEAEQKPTLICVGTVGEVEQGNVSKSEDYIVQPIKLEPLDAGRATKIYFLYRPEWLVPGFSPRKLKEANAGAHFVYSKNIDGEEGVSVLRGLCGSQEAFSRLANLLLHLPIDPEVGGPSIDDVTETLREFFANNVDETGMPVKVGYILVQDRVKTDEINPETGKNVWILQNRYSTKEFFDVTGRNIKFHNNRANKSGGKVKFTYSSQVPF